MMLYSESPVSQSAVQLSPISGGGGKKRVNFKRRTPVRGELGVVLAEEVVGQLRDLEARPDGGTGPLLPNRSPTS